MQATASPTGDAGEVRPSEAAAGARSQPNLWWSSVWAFVGLLVFVGIFNFLLPDLGANLDQTGLIGLGLLFSLVPAVLWLVIFYRIDSREPEPKRLVAGVYAVGLLLAAAIYLPILNGVFNVDTWLYRNWWTQLVGEVLVVGVLGMGLVYLAVRATVFDNPEFDERLDGIIYAMAAGLGIGTVINFMYVFQHGGVDLGIGSIRMVTNALGYATFGGVLGYFIGQVRFEKTPAYYLPMGVGIAALLNGFYFFALDHAAQGPFDTAGWRDLLLAGFLAVVVLAFVGALVRRTNEETARVSQLTASGDAWELRPVATAPEAAPESAAELVAATEPAAGSNTEGAQ